MIVIVKGVLVGSATSFWLIVQVLVDGGCRTSTISPGSATSFLNKFAREWWKSSEIRSQNPTTGLWTLILWRFMQGNGATVCKSIAEPGQSLRLIITTVRMAAVAFPLVGHEVDERLVTARRRTVTIIVLLATPAQCVQQLLIHWQIHQKSLSIRQGLLIFLNIDYHQRLYSFKVLVVDSRKHLYHKLKSKAHYHGQWQRIGSTIRAKIGKLSLNMCKQNRISARNNPLNGRSLSCPR